MLGERWMVKGKANTKDLMNILIYVVFAVVILPIIGSNVATLDDDANFSAQELLLIGLITTFTVLGIVYAIIKSLL